MGPRILVIEKILGSKSHFKFFDVAHFLFWNLNGEPISFAKSYSK